VPFISSYKQNSPNFHRHRLETGIHKGDALDDDADGFPLSLKMAGGERGAVSRMKICREAIAKDLRKLARKPA